MKGNTAYAISNKKITGVATGFDHATRTSDTSFDVFFIDGSKVSLNIPIPENGVDGQDGVSVTGYTLVDGTHLVWDFSDGTQSAQMEIPKQIVSISQESGNALVQKSDGLFVCATGVEVSSETDNAIEEKADGLYVKKTTDVVDSLDSTETGKPLSANQGKQLDDKKLDKTTNTSNAGKYVSVDNTGNLIFSEVSDSLSYLTSAEVRTIFKQGE